MGKNDTLRAAVKGAGGQMMFKPRYAHDRRDAGILGGDGDLRGDIDVHGIMFHVDEEPIKARRFHRFADIDRPRLAHTDPQGELSGLQPLLRYVLESNQRICSFFVVCLPVMDERLTLLKCTQGPLRNYCFACAASRPVRSKTGATGTND